MIKEIQLEDVINELPNITELYCERDFQNKKYDLFFCALGFEPRCLTIPEQLAETKGFRCARAISFEYSTNKEDNENNKSRLINAFKKFSGSDYNFLPCDHENFSAYLRDLLNNVLKKEQKTNILFDISVCSSKLLLTTLKIFFEFDISLHIVYSEASVYHPTQEEYEQEPEKWITEEGFGLTHGIGKVMSSPEHPGARRELPDLVIAFLTFKPERSKAIITDIDDTLLEKPNRRLICVIGIPHREEIRNKRMEMMQTINREILKLEGVIAYEISTFDYKDTLRKLEQIYKENNLKYHINISALGSKMQSIGISLFHHIRPDVTIYLAIPEKYNAKHYSEGCIGTWQINFGSVIKIRQLLDRIGQIVIDHE